MNKPMSCLCVFSVVWCVVLCSGKSLNRLGENRKEKKKKKKIEKLREKHYIYIYINRHTGYPALDPTANKYLSGSGWEIMYFCCFLFVCFSRSSYLLFLLLYVFLFDCKCNSLNRLGENQKKRKNNKTTEKKQKSF